MEAEFEVEKERLEREIRAEEEEKRKEEIRAVGQCLHLIFLLWERRC